MATLFMCMVIICACSQARDRARAIYVLLDVSQSYIRDMPNAVLGAKFLITKSQPYDSFVIARINECSFSDQAIVVRAKFPDRPSQVSATKGEIAKRLNRFAQSVQSSMHTDITGALYQAAQYLHEANALRRYLIIFSDMEEDLPPGCQRQGMPDLKGIRVLVVNATKLPRDNQHPPRYFARLDHWRDLVLKAGAESWRVLQDPSNLADAVYTEQ